MWVVLSSLVINAVKPVGIEGFPVTQGGQDLARVFTEFCLRCQLQNLFEVGDGFSSSILGSILILLCVDVVGHVHPCFLAQGPPRGIRLRNKESSHASLGAAGPLLQEGFTLADYLSELLCAFLACGAGVPSVVEKKNKGSLSPICCRVVSPEPPKKIV